MPTALRYLLAAVQEPRMALEFASALFRADSELRQEVKLRYGTTRRMKGDLAQLLPRTGSIGRFATDILDSEFDNSMRRAISSDEYARSGLQGHPISRAASMYSAQFLYVLCRVLRPRCVVETGVGPGVSTAHLLKAMDDNRLGWLYSINMPGRDQELWQCSRSLAMFDLIVLHLTSRSRPS